MTIVYAHPNRGGHCGYVLERIAKQFEEKGKDFEIVDLYVDGFDPVLKDEELYTSGNRKISTQTEYYQNIFSKEREFIFVYPTWWNGTPAILKGFFDKVFTSGFAFEFDDHGMPHGLLKGKALVITTTGGPVIYEKILAGNRSLRVVTYDTLNYCGLKTKGVIIGNARSLEKNRDRIETKVRLALKFFDWS